MAFLPGKTSEIQLEEIVDATEAIVSSLTGAPFLPLAGGTMTGAILLAAGTVSAPSLSFDGDANTGIYSGTSDTIFFATGGTQRLQLNSTGLTLAGVLSASAGSVGAPSITFTGDTDTGIFSATADTIKLVTAGSERMRIGSGGLVGIGTSAPVSPLHVVGGDAATIAIVAGSTKAVRIGASSSICIVDGVDNTGSGSYQPLKISGSTIGIGASGGADALFVTSGNRVGIGTASPATLLEVSGVNRNQALEIYSSTANPFAAVITDSINYTIKMGYFASGVGAIGGETGSNFVLLANGTESVRLTNAGFVGIGTSSPSGILEVAGGTAGAAADGTNITLTAQSGGSGNTDGGNVVLFSGTKSGAGNSGGICVNTTTNTDSSYPYKMVVKVDGGNTANNDGGVLVTTSQAVTGFTSLLAVVNYRTTDSFYGGSAIKNTLSVSSYFTAAIPNRFVPSGNLIVVASQEDDNLTYINQYCQYSVVARENTTSSSYNYFSNFYLQFGSSKGSIKNGYGYYSTGHMAVGGETITTFYDFLANEFTTAANGTITTRYGLYMDFTTAGITNAYGVYQTDSAVKNYFNGKVGIGTNNPGTALEVNGIIAVKSGASSALARVGGAIFDHYADVNNGTTVETDLYTDTIAASTLGTNGDKIIAQYGGIFTGSATSTQQLKVYFGGTVIFDSGALAIGVATPNWDIKVTAIRASSSVVRCSVTLITSSAALLGAAQYTAVTGLTLTNTQIIKITGTAAGVGAGSNQITASEGTVSWFPAA